MRKLLGAAVAAVLCAALLPAASLAAPVAVQSQNMEWEAGLPSVTGSSMAFFERADDSGGVRRYAAVGIMGYGVEFIDITAPTDPKTVGRHVSPGVNYHTDMHVNVARDILVMNVDAVPGTGVGLNLAQGIGTGVEFVDIADLAAPERLSVVPGLDGPHKLTLVGDNHVYTTLPTYIIDYTDATSPENLGRPDDICGHGISIDPRDPDTAYVAGCTSFRWMIVDVSSPANPVIKSEFRDVEIQTPHDAIPSPDGSVLAVSDLRSDYFTTQCPGGGIHFYDISGAHIAGADPINPKKLGTWFPPFTGARNDPQASDPYGSCTVHGFAVNRERLLIASASYMAGGWLVDFEQKTTHDGFYDEYQASPGNGLGPTTWANTVGNWLSPADFTWYLRWAPFDDEAYERTMFSVSPVHGFEVLTYTGPLPDKVADLTVDRTATGGAVSGRLGRLPLLTAEGWHSAPLDGRTVEVTADGTTLAVATDDGGRFIADLGLGPGTHEVHVAWAGEDGFHDAARTVTVTAP